MDDSQRHRMWLLRNTYIKNEMNDLPLMTTDSLFVLIDLRCTADGVLVCASQPIWYDLEIDSNSYLMLNHVHPLVRVDHFLETISCNVGVAIDLKTNGSHFKRYSVFILLTLIRLLAKYYSDSVYSPAPFVLCDQLSVLKELAQMLSFFTFPYRLGILIADPVYYLTVLLHSHDTLKEVLYICPARSLLKTEDIYRWHQLGYRVLPWNFSTNEFSLPCLEQVDGAIFDYTL